MLINFRVRPTLRSETIEEHWGRTFFVVDAEISNYIWDYINIFGENQCEFKISGSMYDMPCTIMLESISEKLFQATKEMYEKKTHLN